jgi:serine/threonine protein kinase
MVGTQMSAEDKTVDAPPNNEALAPGSKLLSGQYEIIRYLSSGGFGITYLAKDSLNRTVVIKECFPEAFCSRVNKTVRARTQNYIDDFKSVVRLFIREAHALSKLDHAHVVGVHQVFEDNETAYMALDLVDGKDLLEIIETEPQRLKPAQVRKLTLDLLDAVSHVHGQDLLHRDISPDNVLVDKQGNPVLIDFGAAREEASRKSRVLSAMLVVKDGYSPQEFYVAGSQQSPASDLYALAATLVHVITGEAPPNSQARLAALAGGQADPYRPLEARISGYEPAYLAAIDKAMSIVPGERIQSAEEWMLLIDETKRAERARAQAEEDKTIDFTVMTLVQSVNKDLTSEERARIAMPRNTDTVAPQPEKPKPQTPEILSTDAGSLRQNGRPHDLVVTPEKLSAEEQAEASLAIALAADDRLDDAAVSEAIAAARAQIGAVPDQQADRADTPYARILAAAAAKSKAAEPKPRPAVKKTRAPRLATVPVVFLAYFFYGHTALQFEEVRAATVEPIIALGAEQGLWATPPTVQHGG